MAETLWLLTALLVKHFVFDFFWQPAFMWKNKGDISHWGGYAHAGVHSLATAVILLFFDVPAVLSASVAVFEFIIHYTIDWCKMNLNAKYRWEPNTHNEFWQLTGLDQLLHQLTYIAIAAYYLHFLV